tara:strand:+ start:8711 stop:8887 length:177 start_codon:yes stop_codon:yes gene_type:complete
MQWMIENWLLLLFGVGMIGMHLFGHRHGGKGGHDHGAKDPSPKQNKNNKDQTEESTDA